MVVKFSKQNSNYTQQNIIDILSVVSMQNPLIYNLMMSPNDYILVQGDIHRSQFTSDNINNNYWFKIKGYINDFPVAELSAAHVYVCFRKIIFNYINQQYVIGGCVNPRPYKGTDLADISNMRGTWEFVKITYGLSPRSYAKRENLKKIPLKRESKKLQIVDPKTGKPIQIGGKNRRRKQRGGMRLKKLPKDLENLIIDYKKQFEDQEKKQKNLRKQIDQKYKKLEKLENKEPLTDKESIELMTIDIELPIYVKYYLLNDGDYSNLLISKDFQNPEDLETDESELYEDEKDILKKVKKTLYGGTKSLDEFLAEGISNLKLNNDEVNNLIIGIKKMKVVTPNKVESAFQKIIRERGERSKQRKKTQKGSGLFSNKKIEKTNDKLKKENKKIKEELNKLKEENKKLKKDNKEERKKRYDCLYDLKQLKNPRKKKETGISKEEVRIINKFLKLQNKK